MNIISKILLYLGITKEVVEDPVVEDLEDLEDLEDDFVNTSSQNVPTFVASSLLPEPVVPSHDSDVPRPSIPGQESWDIGALNNILSNQIGVNIWSPELGLFVYSPFPEASVPSVPSAPPMSRNEPLQSIFIAQSCPICLEDYDLQNDDLSRLPCGHIFHKDCGKEFIKKECPICREKF